MDSTSFWAKVVAEDHDLEFERGLNRLTNPQALTALNALKASLNNEFRQPLSIDEAPEGSACEWCGKPAEHRFTALGGKFHNESGLLCRTCGDEFVREVASSLCREVTPEDAVYG